MCNSNTMVVANHLKLDEHALRGNLSFRRGSTCVLEIDLCVTKSLCINIVQELKVNQSIKCSDHAFYV